MNPNSGFFEIFVYIARRFSYRWELSRSSSWPVVDAILVSALPYIQPYELSVSLIFRYGQEQTAEQRIPRFFEMSAKGVAKHYAIGSPCRIRLDPANSGKAFLIPS